MRRYILLTLALLLIFAVQMVPQGDLFDGDGSVSVAVLSKTHLHTPSCTRAVRLVRPQRLEMTTQSESRSSALPECESRMPLSTKLISVLRC
jgi:hypothetical protein